MPTAFRLLPQRLLLAAALPLAAAACRDDASSPTATAPRAGGPSLTTAAATAPARPQLVPNSVKYRDRGLKPATGRSGSASLSVQALRGRDGVTEVEITTGEIGQASAPGDIAKVQLKAFDSDGRLISVRNDRDAAYAGSLRYTFPGLARGTRLQAQANVRGIDGNRTDVVTATDVVKRRPDLAVRLVAPERVRPGLPVNVMASVSERNGDVGATADCLLYVDGSLADQARGIWVDAGDEVACAFTLSFPTAGARTLEVRVGAVRPGDDDPANNAASAVLEVASEEAGHIFTAQGDDRWSRSRSTERSRWETSYGAWGEEFDETSDERWEQWTYLDVRLARGLRAPLTRVELSQESGGAVLHSAVLEDLPNTSWGDSYCTNQWLDGGVSFWLCAWGDGSEGETVFSYQRYTGSVTYHSRGYSAGWDQYTGSEYFYTRNYSIEEGSRAPHVPFGDDLTLSVTLVEGADAWTARHVVPLTGVDRTYGQPLTCETYEYVWDYTWRQERCWTWEAAERTRSGRASSFGA